jgi:hypothetical protein
MPVQILCNRIEEGKGEHGAAHQPDAGQPFAAQARGLSSLVGFCKHRRKL